MPGAHLLVGAVAHDVGQHAHRIAPAAAQRQIVDRAHRLLRLAVPHRASEAQPGPSMSIQSVEQYSAANMYESNRRDR